MTEDKRDVRSPEVRYPQNRLVAYVFGALVALCMVASFFVNDKHGDPLYSNLQFWVGVSCFTAVASADLSRPAAIASTTHLKLYPRLYGQPVTITLENIQLAVANVLEFQFTMRGGEVIGVPVARFSRQSEGVFRRHLTEFSQRHVWPSTHAA